MEEHIKSYSTVKQQALKNKQALKKKQAVIAVIVVALIVLAAVVLGIIKANTHKAWLGYMDKYYYPFLEINNIEDNATIENDYTIEKEYPYNNKCPSLMTQRPREDHFDFYVELRSESRSFDERDRCCNYYIFSYIDISRCLLYCTSDKHPDSRYNRKQT